MHARTPSPFRTGSLSLSLALSLAACGKSAPPSAQFDAGPAPDGSHGFDLPPLPDITPSPDLTPVDTGVDATLPADVLDAGLPTDLPASLDSGMDSNVDVPDATSPDGGPRDTGVTVFDIGVDAGPPRRDGPRLVAPLSGSASPGRRPVFQWATFAGAAHYRIEFSTTRAFRAVEASFMADGTSFTPASDRGPGRRFWRVVPLLADGSAGPPSLTWEIDLGRTPGDLDGDGIADVAVGTADRNASTGAVDIYLGASTLPTAASLTLVGRAMGESFGAAVSVSGDVNGDGFNDLLVGAPLNDHAGTGAGRVYLYLGGPHFATTPALTLDGPGMGASFGASLAILGDADGDGYDDFAVGAPLDASTGSPTGKVYVYFGSSTPDGTRRAVLGFATPGDQFGRAVAAASDVDGDGLVDVLVGAPHNTATGTASGQAYLYLGGATFHFAPDADYPGSGANVQAGTAVAGLGDFNGDGYADVAVGAPFDTTGAPAGQVYLTYGSWPVHGTPDLRLTGASGEAFGRTLAGLGDINNDGFADLGVGAPFNGEVGLNAGHVYIFPGAARPTSASGGTLANSIGGDQFGSALAAAGDVDHDGYVDFVVGAPFAPFTSRTGPGTAYLYRGGAGFTATPAVTWRGMSGDQYGISVALRTLRGSLSPAGG